MKKLNTEQNRLTMIQQLKISFWSVFVPLRAQYFFYLHDSGMHDKFALEKAEETDIEEIKKTLTEKS